MDPIVSGYIGSKAGFINTATREAVLNGQVFGGVFLEFDDKAYIKSDIGVGSAFQANLELGKVYDVSEKFSVKNSVGVDYFKSFIKKENNNVFNNDSTTDTNNEIPSWKPNNFRGYGNIEANYTTRKLEFGLGLQMGVKLSKKPVLLKKQTDEADIYSTEMTKIEKASFYIAPIINARFKIADNTQLQVKTSTEQCTLGILHMF